MPVFDIVNTAGGFSLQPGNPGSIQFYAEGQSPTSGFQADTQGNVTVGTVGAGLQVKEGANARMGTVVLVAGSAVVANSSVTATSRILLTSQVDGGTPGWLRVSTRTTGTSFTITSSSGTDTSTVAFLMVEAI